MSEPTTSDGVLLDYWVYKRKSVMDQQAHRRTNIICGEVAAKTMTRQMVLASRPGHGYVYQLCNQK